MIYISPNSGREYVGTAAGGHGKMRTKQGDYVVAFGAVAPALAHAFSESEPVAILITRYPSP